MAVVKINSAEFSEKVLGSSKKVLVDFYADWCGPCKMLAPFVQELSEERTDCGFFKVNVDECMDLAQKYGISSIPALIVFKDGEPVARSVGFQGKGEINMLLG